MGATTLGALVGGEIDSMSGDDGAIIGAITANVLKVAIPVAITYAIGWAVIKGASEAIGAVTGKTASE